MKNIHWLRHNFTKQNPKTGMLEGQLLPMKSKVNQKI